MKYVAFLLAYLLTHICSAQFTMLETNQLELVTYDIGHEYVLHHAGRCFHNALNFHRELFEYDPTEKTTILIQDFGDYGNAGATAVPKNSVSMGLSPFSYAFETSPAGERVFTMMNHELVHVLALDQATSGDKAWRGVFLGKVVPTREDPVSIIYGYLTNPRRYSPRWYHEGIASYVETWMSGGKGLALGSYDEMVFRTRVLEGARLYSAQGLEAAGVTTDFQGRTNSYLYGTRFMSYLAYNYGPQSIIEWVKRKNKSKASFVKQFKSVYGKSINEGWDEWLDFERNWQHHNVDSLQQYPLTQATDITDKILGSVSYPHYDKKANKVYLAVNYPGQVPHLASLDLETGKLSKLTDVKGAALFYVSSVTYDPDSNVIYYTADNDAWRDLHSYNLNTGKERRVQKDVRTGDLTFNRTDKSIWGIRHYNGFSTIVKIPYHDQDVPDAEPYTTWDQVYTFPYGQDIYDIDISPDGTKLSAAITYLNGDQTLLVYDVSTLRSDSIVADTIFNFDVSSPQGFRFTDDGRYLIGSSYYSGVSNIFKVDVETKYIWAMSNALTGLFRPIQIDEERLFAYEFRSSGFQPVFIPNDTVQYVTDIDFLGNITVEKYPELEDWQIPIATRRVVDLDTLIEFEGDYKPWKLMNVNYGYPTVVGYKKYIGLGYRIEIADPYNFQSLSISAAYTPEAWSNGITSDLYPDTLKLEDNERFHASLTAKKGKFTFHAGFNEANFYDLFGPRQSSRKGLVGELGFEHTLIYDSPMQLQLNSELSAYYGLDQSPNFQQIMLTGVDQNFYLNLSSSLVYSNLKSSLGGVDAEKGISALLYGSLVTSAGNLYPRLLGTFDWGIQLPGRHLSFWLRTAAGSAFGAKFNPFTRFGFAAFGNNYVDFHSPKQYRGPFSFPGLSYTADKSIIAENFGKVTGELVLPPIRFRKAGGFSFFANWVQASVFGSFLGTRETELDNNEFEPYANVGAQIDLRLVTFSFLPSTISFGYANAWDIDAKKRYNEWMISLQLLR